MIGARTWPRKPLIPNQWAGTVNLKDGPLMNRKRGTKIIQKAAEITELALKPLVNPP